MTETEASKEVVQHLNLDDSDEGISGLQYYLYYIICIPLEWWPWEFAANSEGLEMFSAFTITACWQKQRGLN
jgi:hypothetical protein